MQPILAIFELEDLLTKNMNLMPQERQSYPPFIFCTGSGSLGHYLLLHQPEKNIFTRFHYTYCEPVGKYRFLDLVIKNKYHVIGKVFVHSRIYEPPCVGCLFWFTQSVKDQVDICYQWDTENLTGVELFTGGHGYGLHKEHDEIKCIEGSLGFDLPWKIDPGVKIQEIFDFTGYKTFFDKLVAETPCELCRKPIGEHKADGHQYKPLLLYNANNTFCKICQKSLSEHGKDHEFEPEFERYHFDELLSPFPTFEFPY